MTGYAFPPSPFPAAPAATGAVRSGQNVAQLRAAQARYQADAVMSASPERLLTMLYDRLVLDLERGEAAQQAADWAEARTQLQHAQAIVAELNASLADTWEGSAGLRGVYAFLTSTLIDANVSRDPQRTRACLDLVAPLRDAWHQAAQQVGSASAPAVATAFPAQAHA
ncbi:flagellar export chaperone FliS [Microbacterium sp. JZ31]|uniref:flagellar export chaperone FliS n=1 Tax=Microbacterium sp. JZ31 TaxID=1906274 RepID=UPI001931A105|nr:flagellar export chaperone FliS [Microbacterium sp. JZ31]